MIAIHQQNVRIQELLRASIQIAEHMNESGSIQQQVDQIKDTLRQQSEHMSSGSGPVSADLNSAVAQCEQIVDSLRQHEWEAYNAETSNDPAQFESNSLEQQLDQSQAYREKIDFKSLKKIKENLEEIRNLANSKQ